jgi:demethylmenaquinone methyltransferase/2-methoxy-6-polyprenyl-1,4-benzoquinol methylase
VADEVKPQSFTRRAWNCFLRFFLKMYVFVRSGQTTKALTDFPSKLERSGFRIVSSRLNVGETFLELVAQKP